jgi:hypothetical protein
MALRRGHPAATSISGGASNVCKTTQ